MSLNELQKEISEYNAGKRRVNTAKMALKEAAGKMKIHALMTEKETGKTDKALAQGTSPPGKVMDSGMGSEWLLPVSLFLILVGILGIVFIAGTMMTRHSLIIEHNTTYIIEQPTIYRTVNNITNVKLEREIIRNEVSPEAVEYMNQILDKEVRK